MAIENTPSRNIIVSNFEEAVSAHTILAGTLNVKEDMEENAPDIPKNNYQRTVFQTIFQAVVQTIVSELTSRQVITSRTTASVLMIMMRCLI